RPRGEPRRRRRSELRGRAHAQAGHRQSKTQRLIPLYPLSSIPMKSINTVTLLGHVIHDPESKTVGARTACTFGLTTNRVWKDANGEKQEQAEFHHLVAWGRLGEFCGKYLKKGKPVYVEGHLKTGSWENPQGIR